MIWTIALVLLVLWALGFVALPALGGIVHVLLVLALIVILFNFLGGGRSGNLHE